MKPLKSVFFAWGSSWLDALVLNQMQIQTWRGRVLV